MWKTNLFIPQKYFEGSVEDFWRRVTELDAEFEARRKRLAAEGKRWRFVACMDHGATEVSLREVGPDSPFYHLAGSNNVIFVDDRALQASIRCRSKGTVPVPVVTAAGVFADIIRIANIR